MKVRLFFCLLTLLMASALIAPPIHAQLPLLEDNHWGNLSPETTLLLTPEEFAVYFHDQYQVRTSTIYDTSDFYLMIETPPGWTNIYASCVVFYPNYVQSITFTNKYLGNSGIYRNGPYRFERGDPEGQYTFRVTLRYTDASLMARESQNAGFLQFSRTRPYPYPTPHPPYPPYPPYPRYPPTPPTIVTFLASPATIRAGEIATLTWNVTDATIISITPEIGNVQSAGSITVTPALTTTYTLSASNYAGGATNRAVSVTVEPTPPIPTPTPPPPPIPYPTPAPEPVTAGDSNWLIYFLVGILVVIIIAALLIFIVSRRPALQAVSSSGTGTSSCAPPTQTPTISPAKLVLPDNSELPITGTTMSVGRSNFSKALPSDQLSYISRQQFQLSYENGRYYIEDLRSMNGTRVNGSEIRGTGKREIRNGDTIEMSNVARLVFRTF